MNILFGLILIVIGVVNAAWPEVGWHLSEGWKFKDAEPSDTALFLGRLGGIVAIVAGIICFFIPVN